MKPEVVVTEDSNSGFQFFSAVCSDYGLKCDTVSGKSGVFHYLNRHRDEKLLIIADGAAFGSEMDRVIQLLRERENAALYLPESFEWLVLLSGVLKDYEIVNILEKPYEFIESKTHFSWERFFTALLVEKTANTYLAYSKKTLNSVYAEADVKKAILDRMGKIKLNWRITENQEDSK